MDNFVINIDKTMHRAYKAGMLRRPSGVRCRQCGTTLETAYHEERLYSVKCCVCDCMTLVKAENPNNAALKVAGYLQGKSMNKYEMATALMACFPHSFITGRGEFIAHEKSNTYLVFDTCETLLDLQCKVIEWLSRAAYKTEPYRSKRSNDEFHRFILAGVNAFLGTAFTYDDMDLIYTYMGNACNHKLTEDFVKSDFDMQFLRAYAWIKDGQKNNVVAALESMGAQAHGEG